MQQKQQNTPTSNFVGTDFGTDSFTITDIQTNRSLDLQAVGTKNANKTLRKRGSKERFFI